MGIRVVISFDIGMATNIFNQRNEYESRILEQGYTYPDVQPEPAD